VLGSLEVRDAVGLHGRGAGDAVGRGAAVAGGYVDGDVGGAAEGGAVSGVCEAGQVREEGAATGLARQEAEGLAVADMQYVHKPGGSFRGRLSSTPPIEPKENRKLMDEGYELLIELANRYLKNEGPPAQPPAWLQPPAPQNGGTALLTPRRRRVRRDEGRVVLPGAGPGQRVLAIKTAGVAV